ncbi:MULTISPECIES: WecB/TagA/CpsF family glycosyltransferase [unclassified Coleofasciculus]|uniref:WecB/TagA/CpsF family glycosyltransferase n=1 Tax=unclassified Coleofasciculus TaxID=2692782 RepID=UPI00187F2433|nr:MULTISPECIES: WecB/TagA/CpsF family glycosyltransferase [unclassified Coleofasciculus]MBE9127169.1 WecB/TagA/CpsF family glycosyltransferase [Coleofasciculus sp. LEGE 07081]MBE9150490.1 WecB/TagA/CpsF family glycosyltransferase [Coleofasciculus sp. LEGE 07092]
MLEAPKQFPVMGLPVHLCEDYNHWLGTRLNQKVGSHVVTLNAEMVMQAEYNDALADVIHQAELVVPDGAGVIFYLLLHSQRQQRCPGIELAESLLRQAGQLGESCPVFFYGGKPEIVQDAARVWQEQLPELAIAGIENGYLSAEAEQDFKINLAKQQPSLILVGLGVPRQELWIAQHRHLCPQAIWIGVGGSFDIWAGVKSRAPVWLRDNYLEWLYRLYQEPWRWRRMMALPQFALKAIGERFA